MSQFHTTWRATLVRGVLLGEVQQGSFIVDLGAQAEYSAVSSFTSQWPPTTPKLEALDLRILCGMGPNVTWFATGSDLPIQEVLRGLPG